MAGNYTGNYFMTDDHVRLYYEEYGTGEKVVLFVHGYTDSSAGFRHISSYWPEADFRVITYDLRAHGRSQAPEYGYSMHRYAQDLHGLIEHLGVRNIHIIGYSMGVHILYDYIRQYGDEKFASLIITSMSPNIVNRGDYNLGMKGYAIDVAMEAITKMNDHYEEEKAKTNLTANGWITKFPYLVELYVNAASYNQHAMIRLQLAMIAGDYWDVLGCITKPTLVIGAENDIYPFETFKKQEEAIAGARLVMIPGFGHLFYLQAPEVYAEQIRSFIEGVS